MSGKIQVRRGTDAQRLTQILDVGEPGYATDTKQFYIGDGTTFGGNPVTNTQISFKNKFINGNFDNWQRGTSASITAGSAAYLADRFNNQSNGGSTTAVSQQAFTLGQTAVPGEPTFFIRHVVTSVAGASNGYRMQHKIESVRTLAGQIFTLSFWAKADAARNIAVQFTQVFGVGVSANVDFSPTTFALTTSWQKFTLTTTAPSIAGKTLAANDTLVAQFWMDAGSSFNSVTNSLGQQSGTFDFAQVQLEPGSVATGFEARPPEVEFALCQRYCQKIFNGLAFGVIGFGIYGSTTVVNISLPTPVSMRSAVTLTKVGNFAVLTAAGASVAVSSMANGTAMTDQVIASCTMASAGTTGNPAQLYCNNDTTAYILLDAEL